MTKKRQIIQVDEEKLKMMIAGDIPIKADPDNDVVIVKPTNEPLEIVSEEEKDNPAPVEKKLQKPTVKRKQKENYNEIFLRRLSATGKRQTSINIDEENYNNIMKIIKTTEGIGLGQFINNVLYHHFEIYEDEITEIKRTYIKNLFNE